MISGLEMHRVSGKDVYDARLVAAMLVHGVRSILTFDAGFARYGVQVTDPTVSRDDL